MLYIKFAITNWSYRTVDASVMPIKKMMGVEALVFVKLSIWAKIVFWQPGLSGPTVNLSIKSQIQLLTMGEMKFKEVLRNKN